MPVPAAVRLALRAARRELRRREDAEDSQREELRQAFDELANRAEDLAIARKKKMTDRIVNDAKRNAPVVTGRLRRSIEVTRNSSRRSIIEATVEYAKYVEFGTKNFSGRYFMRKAFRKAKSSIRGRLRVAYRGRSLSIPWSDIFTITYKRRMSVNPRIEITLDPTAIDKAADDALSRNI